MTPNTDLKAHGASLTRAELPPLLDDSRDWQKSGSEAPELEPDAVEEDASASESAAPDLTFDVAIVGRGYVGLPTALVYDPGADACSYEDAPRTVGGVAQACGESGAAYTPEAEEGSR
jgi:hypothetical protein